MAAYVVPYNDLAVGSVALAERDGEVAFPAMLLSLGNVIAVLMVASFPVVLTGAMSVEMRADIAFDNGTLGVAVTSYYVVSAVLSTASGQLTERIGPRWTTRAAAGIAAVACLTIAFADRLAMLVVALLLGGASIALAQPASNAVIMERVPFRRRGLAFGIKQSSIPGGTALAGMAVPAVALTVGWRWAFVGAALLAAGAVFTVPMSSQSPRSRGTPRSGQLRGSYRVLVALASAAALAAAPAMSLPVFLTTSATDRDFSDGFAGALLALGSVVGLLVRLVVGARADRRVGGHLRPIALLMSLGALGLFGMTFEQPVIFTTAVLLAFGAGWAWQGLFSHAVANRWPAAPAAATGITQTGVFVGGILGPPTFGWVTCHRSDSAGWAAFGVMMCAATALMLAVRHWSTPAVPAPAFARVP